MKAMSPGPWQEAIKFKTAEAKANIADTETKAILRSDFRNVEELEATPDISRKLRNETIGGIVLLVCIVVAVCILFFVL